MSLVIREVSKVFSNGLDVLKDINLEIADGEFVCLLGRSGCGKSTLLNLISGLESPTTGEIIHNNKSVKSPGKQRSYIFQEPALFPWLSVGENIEFAMKVNGVSKKEQVVRAKRYLDLVHLTDYADYRIHEISGGMKQRVALARALTVDSDILLMDEPFAALDSHTKNEMRSHLLEIWEKTGKTIIFVTHSIEEAFLLADRVVMMSSEPSRIVKEYRLERPRNLDSEIFSAMIREADSILGGEVMEYAG